MPKNAPPDTVPAPLRRSARRAPDAPALMLPTGEAVSYGALDAAVDGLAARLETAGVGPGDRVACLLPRTPAYVALVLALWRRRAVATPLPAREPPAGHALLLETIAADALVAADAPLPEATPTETRLLRAAEVVGPLDDLAARSVAGTSNAPEKQDAWPASQPLTLVFTSGSTGTPKAALHTAGNHFFSAEGARANLPLAPGDRWLLSLPLYHVGGLAIVLRCLWAGATVAFARDGEPVAAALARTGATHASLVAAQLRRLLQNGTQGATQGAGPPDSVKTVLLGGGPVPPALLAEAHDAGWPLAVSYGLTEMTSQVATTAPGDALGVLQHTAGRPLPHRRVRIRGPKTGSKTGNETGEILVKGRTRFAGYVEAGAHGLRTPFVRAFGEDGWLPTGDAGRLDDDSRLRVAGRLDRQFVSGGENVQPEEIEAALRRLPAVADAAVVPVPHETFGRRPVAFLRAPDGASRAPARKASRLRNALREALPKYKIPDAFYDWPAEARSGLKPDYALLKRRGRALREGE